MPEADDKPFEVKDRRRFDAEGQAQEGPDTADAEPAADLADDAALPPIEFATLVLSLASSVVYHLGELPHPETGRAEKNLPLAQQTIDLLGVLQEKTRGNLTDDETSLLESILYELRIKYVQARR